MELQEAKRVFLRVHTDIELRIGFEDGDPHMSYYVAHIGAEPFRAYTLMVASGPHARLVLLADRSGRVLPGGVVLEDGRHGRRTRMERSVAREVVAYLGEMHSVLRGLSL